MRFVEILGGGDGGRLRYLRAELVVSLQMPERGECPQTASMRVLQLLSQRRRSVAALHPCGRRRLHPRALKGTRVDKDIPRLVRVVNGRESLRRCKSSSLTWEIGVVDRALANATVLGRTRPWRCLAGGPTDVYAKLQQTLHAMASRTLWLGLPSSV